MEYMNVLAIAMISGYFLDTSYFPTTARALLATIWVKRKRRDLFSAFLFLLETMYLACSLSIVEMSRSE